MEIWSHTDRIKQDPNAMKKFDGERCFAITIPVQPVTFVDYKTFKWTFYIAKPGKE